MDFQYERRQLSEIENNEWKNAILHVPTTPRTSVALFKLATGHNFLPNYLFRFGILECPNCSICGEDLILNAQHLLLCPALSSYCASADLFYKLYLQNCGGHSRDFVAVIAESRVRVRMPLKIRRVDELIPDNSVVAQNIHGGVMWRFEEWDVNSSADLTEFQNYKFRR
ncbi:hypothetical protein TNCV_4266341 [Trichonephila clavipes]|nr:hypothetical protein TNCV_4266341 [Trichonephila clavipes]